MKIKKSLLGIVLMFSMLINVIVPNFAFATTLDYNTSVAKMKQLGIIDSTVTNVNKKMTNGELIKAMAVADGLGDSAASLRGKTIFPDVASGSVLSGYVNAVVGEGLLYGTNDGYFHPASSATYQDICVNMVRLLGYSKSDLTGSFPINYIKKASDLELTDKLNLRTTDTISINAAAVMFDRLLSTQVKGSTTKENFSQASNLYTDCIIQDDSDSYDNLADNEILTDKGIMTISAINKKKIQVGPTFRVRIEDGQITKVYGELRATESVTVNTVLGNVVYYDKNGAQTSMTLPSGISYYYHGVKQDYANLNSILVPNMSIIIDNSDKVLNGYAVITDPIYSKPELGRDFNTKSDTLGDITFDPDTKIMKNGKVITKEEIGDRDVVYSVTDINGNNRYILVTSNYIEGNITEFITSSDATNAIEVDKKSYTYSKNMDISNLSSFKTGDLISVMLGHDGKVVGIKSIEQKIGSMGEYLILGNLKTSDKLADNQVITDKGTLTVKDGLTPLEIGVKYQLYVSNNMITKIDRKENSTEKYSVTSVASPLIAYTDDVGTAKTMTLPKASLYYYHGVSVDYEVAAKAVRAYSSIILTKKSDNVGYDYAVIVDANFGEPQVYKADNVKLINQFKNIKYNYIYRNANIQETDLNAYDVVYFVSDIWNKNTFVYVYDKVKVGTIKAVTPDILNPTGVTIDNVNYTFSKYFNKARLNNYDGSIDSFLTEVKVDEFKTLILGIDGTIVDIH
ncbi:S-layer homology domain-containing protein [Clostridium estertheticum]|uniref:S-layer homology domain-containing protein n=2 Tax=Clostridium estertheticum TaxID=238834 RepID=UPI00227D0DA1|nr:S-layer homology domain-containing protein [Clostridium estertheticum]WAG65472.1 S-layer homology domain-containing protein [Clostridium estertheticum]